MEYFCENTQWGLDVWKGSKYALDTAQTECAQHRCPGCHMNILCMFSLGCVSTRIALFDLRAWSFYSIFQSCNFVLRGLKLEWGILFWSKIQTWDIMMKITLLLTSFLTSLLLTLNRFHTLFWCFHCLLWTSKCGLWWCIRILCRYCISRYTSKDPGIRNTWYVFDLGRKKLGI